MFNIIGKIQDKCEQKKGYKNGVILGRKNGRISIDDSYSSIFAIAKDRREIFEGSIIPTILNWQNNLIIFDFKDELYDLTSKYRENIGEEVIRVSKKNINQVIQVINKILNKKKYSLYICISSLEENSFKERVKFLIEKILKNRKEIMESTLFILPYFNILGESQIIKESVYLDRKEKNLKIYFISDVDSLIEAKYNIPILFGSLDNKLIFSNDLEEYKNLKFLQYLIEEIKPKTNELLYFNNSQNIKLRKIKYYEEKYFMKKINL